LTQNSDCKPGTTDFTNRTDLPAVRSSSFPSVLSVQSVVVSAVRWLDDADTMISLLTFSSKAGMCQPGWWEAETDNQVDFTRCPWNSHSGERRNNFACSLKGRWIMPSS